jgi:hypothetical protein
MKMSGLLLVIILPLVVVILLVAGISYGVWKITGGEEFARYNGKNKTLVHEVSCGANSVQLFETVKYLGGSAYVRQPVLYFNQKLVTDTYEDLPFDPQQKDKLSIISFVEEKPIRPIETIKPKLPMAGGNILSNEPIGWNIFVDPQEFTVSQYQTLAECLSQNREAFDKALSTSVFHSTMINQDLHFAANRIDRIIYSAPFRDRLFYPTDPSLKAQGIVMIIQPDGNARISQVEEGSRTLLFSGYLLIQRGEVSLRFETEGGAYQTLIPKEKVKKFFTEFEDENGKLITDFYPVEAV